MMNYETALRITREFQMNHSRTVNDRPYKYSHEEMKNYAIACEFLKNI